MKISSFQQGKKPAQMDSSKRWALIYWNKENSVSTLPTSNISSPSIEDLAVGGCCSVKWNRRQCNGEIAGLGLFSIHACARVCVCVDLCLFV